MTTAANHPAPAEPPTAPVIDQGIIHDLLNPLTSIVGNLHLLDEFLSDTASPQVHKCLAAGVSSAEELRDMLENLRYLMAAGGPLPGPVARVDVASMLERLVKGMRSLDKPPPEVRIQSDPRPVVRGNEKLLRRAADVLLRTVTRLGTRASVAVGSSPDQTIELRFTHHGRVIPADLAGQLFDPNFTQTQHDRGVKIDRARGFWFVRAVAEAHGGSVAYEPRADGGEFLIRLPREHEDQGMKG